MSITPERLALLRTRDYLQAKATEAMVGGASTDDVRVKICEILGNITDAGAAGFDVEVVRVAGDPNAMSVTVRRKLLDGDQ